MGIFPFKTGVIGLGDSWEEIKGWLAVRLTRARTRIGFPGPRWDLLRDGELTVQVPDETTEAWIKQEYTPQIRTAIEELKLPVRRVQYQISASAARAAAAGSGGFSDTVACWKRTRALLGARF